MTSQPYEGRLIQGDGFSVRFAPYNEAIKYLREGQSIALHGQLADKTRELGRTWLILPTFVFFVDLPAQLTWDDGSKLDSAEAERVKDHISWALNKIGQRHAFETMSGDQPPSV